ncbi:hypothetical protein F5883DRAFT_570394 [Diaporthe sp. PMI_573]|nr:hypothetical protein F5883DRAFT_570394 [Diaporthaceae sp. PMI_573]
MFRETCRRWPMGYGVQASKYLRGRRPRHRILVSKNPVSAWLRLDVKKPKGWMVAAAQLEDLFCFSQFQARARKLKPDDPAAYLPKDLLAVWDDEVLPPEYYDTFPADYLSDGADYFLHVETICLSGWYPYLRFKQNVDAQGLGTTLVEYILYLTHRFHVLARAVRTTQAAADRAFAKVVASGILRRDGGTATTPSFSQEDCDAVLLAYLKETAAWREGNMKLIPVWYRIQWTGKKIDELLMHTLLAQGRRKRELGEKCDNHDDSDSDSDLSDGPRKSGRPRMSTSRDMRRAFGQLAAWLAEEKETAVVGDPERETRGKKRRRSSVEMETETETSAAKKRLRGNDRRYLTPPLTSADPTASPPGLPTFNLAIRLAKPATAKGDGHGLPSPPGS